MPHDLLIKGGHVLDPGQNLDGKMDIGITDGKIQRSSPIFRWLKRSAPSRFAAPTATWCRA